MGRQARPWQRMPRAALITLLLAVLASLYFSTTHLQAGAAITPEQAIQFVGSYQTVCGKVVSTKYATEKPGAPTFLNLNRPYPDQVFTALIWGENRGKFFSTGSRVANNQFACRVRLRFITSEGS